MCCGTPRVGPVNNCDRSPSWVVVGTQVDAQRSAPVLLVLTCCDAHLGAVKRFQTGWEDAIVAPIDALPVVLDDLGADVWLATPAAAG